MNLESITLISKAARASENISWDLFFREHCEGYQSPYTDEEIESGKALILHVNERYGTNFTWDEDKSIQPSSF